MSKIGKAPIKIQDNNQVELTKDIIKITGPKGTLECPLNDKVQVKFDSETKEIILQPKKEGREFFAIWGTLRALINNCVVGVNTGFERRLIIEGIGYKAEVQGKELILNVGYSHPVHLEIPEGLTVIVEKTNIIISGISKKDVGDFASVVRKQRKTNPYSMKGIRYSDEKVIKKSGKKAG